jgi:hypothetical protein
LQRLPTTPVFSNSLQGLLAALAGITTRQHFQIHQCLLAEASLVEHGSPLQQPMQRSWHVADLQ